MTQEEIQKVVDEIVEPWKDKDGNLIMVLHQIQNRFSYVPREISFEVAKRLRIPLARIYEVITFFNYFKLSAPGKNIVSVCLGTACYLKGANALAQKVKDELGVELGQTTPDRNFHTQAVRCVGCCGLSPVVTIGEKVYGHLTPDQIPGVLNEYQTPKSVAAGGRP